MFIIIHPIRFNEHCCPTTTDAMWNYSVLCNLTKLGDDTTKGTMRQAGERFWFSIKAFGSIENLFVRQGVTYGSPFARISESSTYFFRLRCQLK